MLTIMGWNGDTGWVSWLLMSVGMVAFWALLVIAIKALLPGVRDDGADRSRRQARGDALRVLDERLARGQLDEQDYRARRELLSHGRRQPMTIPHQPSGPRPVIPERVTLVDAPACHLSD